MRDDMQLGDLGLIAPDAPLPPPLRPTIDLSAEGVDKRKAEAAAGGTP